MPQALRANCIRVLVVEDNRDICENIGDYLGARGHITDFAHDGISAMHLALTEPVDVIVLDLMLPGMDGEVSISNQSGLEVRRSRGSETRGFGLGLSIVERLCEHNGWTFTLDVNRGAIHACLSWEPRHLSVDAISRQHASIVGTTNVTPGP